MEYIVIGIVAVAVAFYFVRKQENKASNSVHTSKGRENKNQVK